MNSRLVQRTALLAFTATCVVVAAKLAGAWASGSVSVLGEALQSLLDIFMSGLAVMAARVAGKPADEDHPFGHGKAELLASALQMVLALGAAGFILWQAGVRFLHPEPIRPDWGLAAMVFSLAVNQVMIFRLGRVAAQTGSAILRSEQRHLQADSLASFGVVVGLALTKATGWLWVDPAAAILFTGLGSVIAVRQLREVLHPLMDGALPPEDLARIEDVLASHPQVRGRHKLRTRSSGIQRLVVMHVMLDDNLTFVRAHEIAEEIESEVSAALGGALVTIHYEPYEAELRHQSESHAASEGSDP